MRSSRRAFTLIELLVVIGIIAVLMSILIPVIGKVRIAGYDASTSHRLQAIMGAIDAYYHDFGAYPGPLADNELYSTLPSSNGTTVKAVNNTNTGSLPPGVTSSENLVLGLLGGIDGVWKSSVPGGPPTLAINYTDTEVGMGPISINVLTQKRYSPYGDPKVFGLQTGGPPWPALSGASFNGSPLQQASLYTDTIVPEFVDAFPDALPILYIRAQSHTAAARATPGAPAPSNTPSATAIVWDPTMLQPYLFPAIPDGATSAAGISSSDAYTGTVNAQVLSDFPVPHYYFTGSDHVTPVSKGGYMLIVAGKDRKFMTRDDRVNGSPVQ